MDYRKFRFAKQLRNYDCVPNTIINLLKFGGTSLSYKIGYKVLYDFFNISDNHGCDPMDAHLYFKNKKLKTLALVNSLVNPSSRKLIKELGTSKVGVLLFQTKKFAHACLVVGHDDKGFKIVNYNRRRTIQTVSFDRFKREVLNYKRTFVYIYERKK